MRLLFRVFTSIALIAIGAGVAQAQSPGCGAMEFSKEVLARFPNVGRACLNVVTREGDPYGVVKAEIVRVYDVGNAVDLRFKLPDGSRTDTRHMKTSPDLRVMVRGKATPVNQLVVGDELTAYVKVHQPVLALAPAEPTVAPQFTPIAAPEAPSQQVAAAMPATAGQTCSGTGGRHVPNARCDAVDATFQAPEGLKSKSSTLAIASLSRSSA